MGILQLTPLRQQHFHHGGCRVLTVLYQVPTGDAPAALHFAEIVGRLLKYAEAELLPDAVCELEALAAAGSYQRFHRRQYRIRLQEKDGKRGKKITVSAELWAGERTEERTLLSHATLETLWNAVGTVQFPLSRKKSKISALPLENI